MPWLAVAQHVFLEEKLACATRMSGLRQQHKHAAALHTSCRARLTHHVLAHANPSQAPPMHGVGAGCRHKVCVKLPLSKLHDAATPAIYQRAAVAQTVLMFSACKHHINGSTACHAAHLTAIQSCRRHHQSAQLHKHTITSETTCSVQPWHTFNSSQSLAVPGIAAVAACLVAATQHCLMIHAVHKVCIADHH